MPTRWLGTPGAGRAAAARCTAVRVVTSGDEHDTRRAAGALTCSEACDCPAQTLCTIEGICEGRACTQACETEADCACGRACVDGFCDFRVGSLTACTHDCECPGYAGTLELEEAVTASGRWELRLTYQPPPTSPSTTFTADRVWMFIE